MDMDDLYQEIILDHFKNPRHAATLTEDEALVDEENPTCGDQIRLTATLDGDGKIADIRYDAKGCAISVASSSMMAESLIGMQVEEAKGQIAGFVDLIRGERDIPADELGDLAALEGVKNYPMRVKCATMCWHAVDDALNQLASKAT